MYAPSLAFLRSSLPLAISSRCHALHISKIGNIQYPLLSHPQLSDIQIDSFLKSIIKIMLGATGVEERRGEEGVVCWKRFVGIVGIA